MDLLFVLLCCSNMLFLGGFGYGSVIWVFLCLLCGDVLNWSCVLLWCYGCDWLIGY